MSETIYAGNGRKVTTQHGDFRSVSICLTDLPKEHMQKGKNGKTYIKLNIGDKQEKDQYGNDVTVTVNTFKPDANYNKGNQNQSSNQAHPEPVNQTEEDELPF